MSDNVILESHLNALTNALANNQCAISTKLDTIEHKIDSISGTSSSSKAFPTLSLSSWTKSGSTFSATISYDGDGSLSTSLGSISGTTLTVSDQDGSFNGTISASEGNTSAPVSLHFSYNTSIASTPVKATPSLSLSADSNPTTIFYDGDGLLFANTDNPYFGVHIEQIDATEGIYDIYPVRHDIAESEDINSYNVTIFASEGANYCAASISAEVEFWDWTWIS